MNANSEEVRLLLRALVVNVLRAPWSPVELAAQTGGDSAWVRDRFRREFVLSGQNIGNAMW